MTLVFRILDLARHEVVEGALLGDRETFKSICVVGSKPYLEIRCCAESKENYEGGPYICVREHGDN